MIIVVKLKGGPGSGHFGHAGRPGLRGGSLSGTGGGYTGRVVYSPSLTSEARYMPDGSIRIGPKFIDLDKDVQIGVLVHEMSHDILMHTDFNEHIWDVGAVLDIGNGMFFGGHRSIEEAAADALTEYATGGGLLGKYPHVRSWAESQYRAAGVNADTIVGQASKAVEKLRGYSNMPDGTELIAEL